jgi:hypothetical protein
LFSKHFSEIYNSDWGKPSEERQPLAYSVVSKTVGMKTKRIIGKNFFASGLKNSL